MNAHANGAMTDTGTTEYEGVDPNTLLDPDDPRGREEEPQDAESSPQAGEEEEQAQTLPLGPPARWHLYQALSACSHTDTYEQYLALEDLQAEVMPTEEVQAIAGLLQHGQQEEANGRLQALGVTEVQMGEVERTLVGRSLWAYIRQQERSDKGQIPTDAAFRALHAEFRAEIDAARGA